MARGYSASESRLAQSAYLSAKNDLKKSVVTEKNGRTKKDSEKKLKEQRAFGFFPKNPNPEIRPGKDGNYTADDDIEVD